MYIYIYIYNITLFIGCDLLITLYCILYYDIYIRKLSINNYNGSHDKH